MVEHRVVVLGGTGFLGSAFADAATRWGFEVVSLGTKDIDLTEPRASAALAGLVAAGDTLVLVSARAPARTATDIAQNVLMVEPVLSAAAKGVDHVVYISSDAVYAEDESYVSEATPPSPTSPHGAMHVSREVALRSSLGDVPFCSIRPSLVYGPGDPHNGYGPNRFWRQAVAGEPIGLFGGGEEQRDHVYVGDVAELICRVVEARATDVYNAVTGDSRSFHDVATLVASMVPEPPPVVPTERKNPITHRWYDVSTVVRAFPGMRWTPLEEGLRHFVSERRPDASGS